MTETDSTELSRRDALAALAAAGVAGGGALALAASDGDGDDRDDGDGIEGTETNRPLSGPIDGDNVETLVAAAEVLYPSEVEGIEPFVSEFVRGRAGEQPDHAAGIAAAVAYLDEWTNSWFDDEFAGLDEAEREDALDRLGVREADPDPDGTDVERVRYYVVNELLFALYTSPTGGELVGLENPQGHPGGIESYRRGPDV
ncbi:hypothetical protein BRC79_07250 [Halobacteriales archaeon QH_8_67_27]|nr:MAG: hypothetical protein BRC79_07250 [Halobacteriales archaeon QH_8_67_27]